MEQGLSIWSDLVERIPYTAQQNQPLYFYTLPQSSLIVHVQTNGKQYSNLVLVAKGLVVEDTIITDQPTILITVDKQQQFKSVSLVQGTNQTPLVLKRTSDVNDLFKNYVCFYSDVANPDKHKNKYFVIIDEAKDAQQYYKVEDNKIQELEETNQQAKKTTKKQQNQGVEQFGRLQQLMKTSRGKYKDIIDSIGKITAVRHPLLIRVSICYPADTNCKARGLTIEYAETLKETICQWVTYHKYDDPALTCLQSHLNLVHNDAQYLSYSEQAALPLASSGPTLEDDLLLLKQKVNLSPQSSLWTQSRKFDQLVVTVEGNHSIFSKDKLVNVHVYLPQSKTIENSRRYTVRGDYVFHHYLQDGFDDKGWGCAYRSFQTVLSWLIINGHTQAQKIPMHKEIQTLLFQMDDKPKEFVGSKEWIGAFEVNMLINKLTGIESKILHISNGPDIVDKLFEFRNHFLSQGTPIMFGGGVYAYTLLGVDYNDEKQCKFLILDPHYTASDNIKTVIDKGGVGWRNVDMFLPGTFYNFCMPQVQ